MQVMLEAAQRSIARILEGQQVDFPLTETVSDPQGLIGCQVEMNDKRETSVPRDSRDWQNASLDGEHAAMEALAAKVVEQFSVICCKLTELRPHIERIQAWYKRHPRQSTSLMGCPSFKAFCEKCLHRDESTVYRMLSKDGLVDSHVGSLGRHVSALKSERSLARWISKTALAFEANGALSMSARAVLAHVDPGMRADLRRISPSLASWFEALATAMLDGGSGSECLLSRHGARRIEDHLGLANVRRFLTTLAADPFTIALLFEGPPGTGKTSMACAFAEEVSAELHHIPAKSCDLQRLERAYTECEYLPHRNWELARAHVFIIDEADQMSAGAQIGFLSALDGTRHFANTVIFIFTTNDAAKLEERFRQRCQSFQFTSVGIEHDLERRLLEIWNAEGRDPASTPDFADIVQNCNANVRVAFNWLERELLSAKLTSTRTRQEPQALRDGLELHRD
jgi:hypothetical protein